MSHYRERELESPEQRKARLAALKPRDFASITDIKRLPRWVKMACARMEILGETQKEAAKHFKRKGSTLALWRRTPAAREWQAKIREQADNPVSVAKGLLEGDALNVALDVLWAFQTAVEMGDYKEVGTMGRDLMDRIGLVKKEAKKELPSTIIIQLGDSSLEIPVGASEAKRLTGAVVPDFEIVEGDG